LGFDEQRLLGVVPEGGSDLEDVALQDFRLDVSVGPQRVEEFIVRQQSPGVLDQIPQEGIRPGGQENPLLVGSIPAAP
jgi:hypothetical protein